MIFFTAGTLQKKMFFVIPIPFRTYTKHFRRFLTSLWSSAQQRWFRENQRWTALKQRWSALVFLTHSETALISAEIYETSETALFSADLLWDFNPGCSVSCAPGGSGWNAPSVAASSTAHRREINVATAVTATTTSAPRSSDHNKAQKTGNAPLQRRAPKPTRATQQPGAGNMCHLRRAHQEGSQQEQMRSLQQRRTHQVQRWKETRLALPNVRHEPTIATTSPTAEPRHTPHKKMYGMCRQNQQGSAEGNVSTVHQTFPLQVHKQHTKRPRACAQGRLELWCLQGCQEAHHNTGHRRRDHQDA